MLRVGSNVNTLQCLRNYILDRAKAGEAPTLKGTLEACSLASAQFRDAALEVITDPTRLERVIAAGGFSPEEGVALTLLVAPSQGAGLRRQHEINPNTCGEAELRQAFRCVRNGSLGTLVKKILTARAQHPFTSPEDLVHRTQSRGSRDILEGARDLQYFDITKWYKDTFLPVSCEAASHEGDLTISQIQDLYERLFSGILYSVPECLSNRPPDQAITEEEALLVEYDIRFQIRDKCGLIATPAPWNNEALIIGTLNRTRSKYVTTPAGRKIPMYVVDDAPELLRITTNLGRIIEKSWAGLARPDYIIMNSRAFHREPKAKSEVRGHEIRFRSQCREMKRYLCSVDPAHLLDCMHERCITLSLNFDKLMFDNTLIEELLHSDMYAAIHSGLDIPPYVLLDEHQTSLALRAMIKGSKFLDGMAALTSREDLFCFFHRMLEVEARLGVFELAIFPQLTVIEMIPVLRVQQSSQSGYYDAASEDILDRLVRGLRLNSVDKRNDFVGFVFDTLQKDGEEKTDTLRQVAARERRCIFNTPAEVERSLREAR